MSATILEPVLGVENLGKDFKVGAGPGRFGSGIVHAVTDVTFNLGVGETLSLVGESGCGKSTTGRLIVRLLEPSNGRVLLRDRDITHLRRNDMKRVRRSMQIVFQDPFASLNPRWSVREILAEPFRVHGEWAQAREANRIDQLLADVGMSASDGERRPHEFSGGQRQRIAIARALALGPEVLVLDEPVSALDLSVQAQILNLLEELRREHRLSVLFISHDLSVVRHISDRVSVMYLGRIVEIGPTEDVFERPRHPYTRALLAAAPVARPSERLQKERIRLRGELPDPFSIPTGCAFRTRCWKAQSRCAEETPPLQSERGGLHSYACFYPEGEAEPSKTAANKSA